jgi:hypothetical protein
MTGTSPSVIFQSAVSLTTADVIPPQRPAKYQENHKTRYGNLSRHSTAQTLLYIHHLPLAAAVRNYASFLPHTVKEFGLMLTLKASLSLNSNNGLVLKMETWCLPRGQNWGFKY